MRKKVLFLIHTLGAGGAEKILVNLVNNLDKEKYDITLMTVIDTGIFKKDLSNNVHYKTMVKLPFFLNKENDESGSLHSNFSSSKAKLKVIYQFLWRHVNTKLVYKLFIKDKYDYEVAFLEGICSKIISSSSNSQSKKIAWLHIDLINEKKSDKFFNTLETHRNCYAKFDDIVCVSDVVKKQAIKKLKLEKSKFKTIYNPIDTNEIISKANDIEIGTNNKLCICSVGRLAPQKGYDRLINVAEELVNEGYEFTINIVGEGPDKDMLQGLINSKKLQGVVNLLGFKVNPYPYIKNCDFFVCSSRAEGFSTVVSEAVVLNKACLVTNCSGMKELFGENGEFGYIVENNETGLKKGIKDIFENIDLIEKYQQQSIINAKRFNLKESIKIIEEAVLNDN